MSTLKVNAITDLSDSPKYQPLLLTAQTASGTAINFTGIPSWVKRITVMLNGVSTNGTSNIRLRLGTSGGIENTGYSASGAAVSNTTSVSGITDGFSVTIVTAAASTYDGVAVLSKFEDGQNRWIVNSHLTAGGTTVQIGSGAKTLADTLTQVRITTVNGTDTFDAGTINLLLE
jgi:hypothetical protein